MVGVTLYKTEIIILLPNNTFPYQFHPSILVTQEKPVNYTRGRHYNVSWFMSVILVSKDVS